MESCALLIRPSLGAVNSNDKAKQIAKHHDKFALIPSAFCTGKIILLFSLTLVYNVEFYICRPYACRSATLALAGSLTLVGKTSYACS